MAVVGGWVGGHLMYSPPVEGVVGKQGVVSAVDSQPRPLHVMNYVVVDLLCGRNGEGAEDWEVFRGAAS